MGGCGAVMLALGVGFLFTPTVSRLTALLIVFGGLLIWLAYKLGERRLVVYSGGIARILGADEVCCRWEDIREIVVAEPSPGGVKVVYRCCSLVRLAGSPIDLVEINFGPFDQMVDGLRKHTESYNIPWRKEVVERSVFDLGIRWLILALISVGVIGLIVGGVVSNLVK
jgi:hypothetical protein